ncbi:MAG: Minf_1886 family protein [Planctomycetota bacterium]
MKKTIEEIAREDGRYDARALKFVFEGLAHTVEKFRQHPEPDETPCHISGQELAWGLADAAQKRWGRLAAMVLSSWDLKGTRDFGEIVYLMIDSGWMTSQETDTIEDFDNVFDFTEVFEKQYAIEIR